MFGKLGKKHLLFRKENVQMQFLKKRQMRACLPLPNNFNCNMLSAADQKKKEQISYFKGQLFTSKV